MFEIKLRLSRSAKVYMLYINIWLILIRCIYNVPIRWRYFEKQKCNQVIEAFISINDIKEIYGGRYAWESGIERFLTSSYIIQLCNDLMQLIHLKIISADWIDGFGHSISINVWRTYTNTKKCCECTIWISRRYRFHYNSKDIDHTFSAYTCNNKRLVTSILE